MAPAGGPASRPGCRKSQNGRSSPSTAFGWGRQSEAAAKHLRKGSQVYVEGHIRTDHWQHEGRDYYRTKIVATSVRFLGRKPDEGDDDANANMAEEGLDE